MAGVSVAARAVASLSKPVANAGKLLSVAALNKVRLTSPFYIELCVNFNFHPSGVRRDHDEQNLRRPACAR